MTTGCCGDNKNEFDDLRVFANPMALMNFCGMGCKREGKMAEMAKKMHVKEMSKECSEMCMKLMMNTENCVEKVDGRCWAPKMCKEKMEKMSEKMSEKKPGS